MAPWVYPFSTQCQYHHADGQWAIFERMDFASLLDAMWVTSTNGPRI